MLLSLSWPIEKRTLLDLLQISYSRPRQNLLTFFAFHALFFKSSKTLSEEQIKTNDVH